MWKFLVRGVGIAGTVLALALPAAVSAAEGDPGAGRFRAAGEVTGVDPAASTFTLHTRAGEDLVITVTDETRFVSRQGEIDGLEDLEAGMKAFVRGEVTADGAHIAKTVGVGNPGDRPDHARYAGAVTSVGDRSFSIQPREGGEVTFLVDENTEFHSRDGSVNGLEDLRIGMHVGVGAAAQDDGSLLALNVLAAHRPDRPRPDVDVRGAGRIVDLGDRELTIETRDGRRLTFAVTEDTVFKSRNGQVSSFGDLEMGMGVAVGGKKSAD
ncbi:MAG: DUF5666 domain-containing protein, partial [Anaerolineales bacterium]